MIGTATFVMLTAATAIADKAYPPCTQQRTDNCSAQQQAPGPTLYIPCPNRLRKIPGNREYLRPFRGLEKLLRRDFADFCCGGGGKSWLRTESGYDYATPSSSFGMRTRLYAAATKVNIQPTRSVPR